MSKAFKLRGSRALTAVALSAGILTSAGCGSSTPAATSSSSVGLKGSLGTSAGADALYMLRKGVSPDQRTSFSGDSVVCATLSTPPVTATAAVNSDGSFSITIDGGANQPLNCNLVDASGDLLASIVSTDSQHTNMQGNPTTADTLAFAVSADLGDVTYNPNTGEATVPVSNISQSLVTQTFDATTAFDPTGNWVIGSVDFTLPPGFVGPCASQGDNCNGPPAGQDIFLKRWAGVQASDEKTPVYAIQIWQDANAFASCGNVLGLTASQATGLGVDFSSNGAAGTTAFSFVSSLTINNASQAITDGYKLAGAVTQYPMTTGCNSQAVTANGNSYNGFVCGPDAQGYYSAGIGGGCVDGSGNAVSTNGNWTPDNTPCTQSDFGSGYQQQTCTGTASVSGQPVAVTCTNISGVFSDSGLTAAVNPNTGAAATTGTFTDGSNVVAVTSPAGIAVGQVVSGSNYIWGNGMSSVRVASISGSNVTLVTGSIGSPTPANAQGSGTSPIIFGAQFDQAFYTSNQIAQGTSCSSLPTSTAPEQLAQEQCYAQYFQQNAQSSDGCTPRVNTDWSTSDPAAFVTVSWTPNNLPLMNQLVYLSASSAASRNEQDEVQGVPSSAGNGQYTNCHVHEVDSISFKQVDSTHILAQYTASDTTSDTGIPDCVANYGDSKTKFLFTLTKQ